MRALIWDVDGTLAETERDGHRVAYNAAFEAEGLPWHWSAPDYGPLLQINGGYERLLHDMASRPDAPPSASAREQLARRLHRVKNEHYARIVAAGGIPLRPGVRALWDDCTAAGVPMAIATTTSRGNVAALLGAHLGPDWAQRFACVMCSDEAPLRKPDPQVYRLALACLGLPAHQVLAIEDAPPGVHACGQAGVPVVVTRSIYFTGADVAGAIAVGPGLHTREGWQPPADAAPGRVDLAQLRRWFEQRGPAPR